MKKNIFLLFLVTFILSGIVSISDAVTITLNPNADSYIAADTPTSNYGNETQVAVSTYLNILAYIRFNLSSIPSGVTINSAKLQFYCNVVVDNGNVLIGRSSSSWTETGITWNNKTGGEAPVVQSTPPGSSQWWEIDVTSIVKKWIEESSTNYGFRMEKESSGMVMFSSRESTSKPRLVITYTPSQFSASGKITSTTNGEGVQSVKMVFNRVSGNGTIPDDVIGNGKGEWFQSGFDVGTTYKVTPTSQSGQSYTFSPVSRNFSSTGGIVTELNFETPTGYDVTIMSNPTGADIRLNSPSSASVGTTPSTLKNLEGNQLLYLTKYCYETYEYTVNPTDAGKTLNFSLTPITPPDTPTGVVAQQSAENGKISLQWNPSNKALGYLIVYDEDGNEPWSPLQNGTPSTGSDVGNVNQITISDLTPGKIYYFAVAAYNCAGVSNYSTVVSSATGGELKEATIIQFTPPSGILQRGAQAKATMRIQNTGSTPRSFWVGLSFAPNTVAGDDWPVGWYDIFPKQTAVLQPNGVETLNFNFDIPSWLPPGQYKADTAVWDDYDYKKHEMLPYGNPFDALRGVSSFQLGGYEVPAETIIGQLLNMYRRSKTVQGVEGDLWEKYQNNVKMLAYLSVSGDIGIGIKGSILIDLADLAGITPEGQEGWITVWNDACISVGIPIPGLIVNPSLGITSHEFNRTNNADVRDSIISEWLSVDAKFMKGIHVTALTVGNQSLSWFDWNRDFEIAFNLTVAKSCKEGVARYEIRREALEEILDVPIFGLDLISITGGLFSDIQNIIDNGIPSSFKIPTTNDDGNWKPDRPTNFIPSDGATGVSTTPVLWGSPFSDYDTYLPYIMDGSHWQVDDNQDFTSPVLNTDGGIFETWEIKAGLLNPLTKYYWKVRYKDYKGEWSEWSAPTSFTTMAVNVDNCPDDPYKTEPGICGCGVPDTDSDSDGRLDCNDNCPNDPNKYISSEEICDGVDNDCDGLIDEDLIRPTTCGVGECISIGEETCVLGVWSNNTCIPSNSTTEVCDNKDNDCDGTTDEGCPQQCSINNDCNHESNCFDSVDNDNDGLTDCQDPDCNGNTDGVCNTGLLGICSAGTWKCSSGSKTCSQNNQPQQEVCNDQLDNDCNGNIDFADSNCGISLLTGWNLISLHKQPANTVINNVLSGISGKYNIIWFYLNGAWTVYDPAYPGLSDLSTIEPGKGYWIYMNSPATLTISGSLPSPSALLSNSWNLVGYNSLIAKPVTEALSSISGKYISVWQFKNGDWKVYNPADPGSSNLTMMEPGYGYWINMKEPATWILP